MVNQHRRKPSRGVSRGKTSKPAASAKRRSKAAGAADTISDDGTAAVESLLQSQPDELHLLSIGSTDVGGELISILSEGLYTNPLDSIREYIQNAVDARADSVTIKFSGRTVSIRDDGFGMSIRDLLQARQFGLSRKSIRDNVGFRGIGIYSGFALCERLRITSKRQGDAFIHTVVFEFAAMRQVLDAERSLGLTDERTPLTTLLSQHTYIKRQSAGVTSRSFTVVDLQDISDVHFSSLANRDELRDYLLTNLPVDFSTEFKYRDQVNNHLKKNVPGFHPIRIVLKYDGMDDLDVARTMTEGLQPPVFAHAKNGTAKEAYVWSCLVEEPGKIEDAEIAGFAYKVKGFTIGDRISLRSKFGKRQQLYPWYTGEVFVLNPQVIPNAARNDFETNAAKDELELALDEYFVDLLDAAEEFQSGQVASRRIKDYEVQVAEIEQQIEAATVSDPLEVHGRLRDILRDVKRQTKAIASASDTVLKDIHARGKGLQDKVPFLQNKLREALGTTSIAEQKKRAAKSKRANRQSNIPHSEPTPGNSPKSLIEVFKEAAWDLDGEVGRTLQIISHSIDDILVPGSRGHTDLLAAIQGRLEDDVEGPASQRSHR